MLVQCLLYWKYQVNTLFRIKLRILNITSLDLYLSKKGIFALIRADVAEKANH